jgi:hypothetical protein
VASLSPKEDTSIFGGWISRGNTESRDKILPVITVTGLSRLGRVVGRLELHKNVRASERDRYPAESVTNINRGFLRTVCWREYLDLRSGRRLEETAS